MQTWRVFFPWHFKAGFQRVFKPFIRGFHRVFPHSKEFQSISKFQDVLQMLWETNWLWSWEFVQPSLAFKLFVCENVAFYKKQNFLFHRASSEVKELPFQLLEIEANTVIYIHPKYLNWAWLLVQGIQAVHIHLIPNWLHFNILLFSGK